ncbi:(2,3-dihydroxybenzoyl)adenylate synthase [Dactylosporangium fulvum]|uniref:(2,3-dihydroxybenzoyl)adenylate synthase n=1 Tax=Dactylosporangium fulvum TaxID=53359 RepID=A0ABY5W9Q4_9ACTN|nr:(2,3-dihydroxybenzoyl)adenylate synthase [Dactylosporangium fulvum]UWP85423.1 (2,3-dihydroxybenzoyl)adenylate synthase [Dactylosporangium fulvum]
MWPDEFARRYRERGYWTGQTFDALLRERAATHGDRVAVVDGERHVTYRELRDRALSLAAGLHRLGVRRGDRVVVQLPNTADYFDVVFALFRLGALPVLALPAHRAAEIGYFCSHTEAVAFVTTDVHEGFDHRTLAAVAGGATVVVAGDPGEHTALAGLYDADTSHLPPGPWPGETAFLQLSGGSTGLPKLIPRTHDDYLYSVRASAEICALTEDSVYLAVLPVAHNFTMSSPGVLGVFHAGGRVVLARRPDPATVLPLIAAERVTVTAVVPPLAQLWLDAVAAAPAPPDLSSLRLLQVGGAKLGSTVAARVTPVLGCRLQQVFGMAEGLVNYTRLDDPDEIVLHTQGRPISPDDEVRVVDDDDRPVPPGTVGHLLTRGPYTIRGYWRADEHNRVAFTADGFYRTGDLVRVRADGYIVVEGRAKDQINRGGEKIAAEEVENHLLTHPAVHDAAIVAVPDPYLGERSCAYVVVRAGQAPVTLATVRRYLRGRGLAEYKIPDRLQILDAFPVTGVGKVSRRVLRATLRATQEG